MDKNAIHQRLGKIMKVILGAVDMDWEWNYENQDDNRKYAEINTFILSEVIQFIKLCNNGIQISGMRSNHIHMNRQEGKCCFANGEERRITISIGLPDIEGGDVEYGLSVLIGDGKWAELYYQIECRGTKKASNDFMSRLKEITIDPVKETQTAGV